MEMRLLFFASCAKMYKVTLAYVPRLPLLIEGSFGQRQRFFLPCFIICVTVTAEGVQGKTFSRKFSAFSCIHIFP